MQYVTPSDDQHKFPLIRELVRGIRLSSLLPGNRTAGSAGEQIRLRVHSYHGDEALVIYRADKEWLADLLLPRRQAQALHIAPYSSQVYADQGLVESQVSEARKKKLLREVLEAQIYNSWWNGYVLGYPESFIDSYCRDFHSDLEEEAKMRVAGKAKAAVQKLYNNISRIHIGYTSEISSNIFDAMYKLYT